MPTMPAENAPVVLLVEDSPDEIDFARRALARSGINHRLVAAENGDRALALLSGEAVEPGHDCPLRPALVLVDLNIPGTSGHDVLRRIKSDARWCSIPVVILSTSEHRRDIESCYRAHANSYHRKSDDLAQYQATARRIVEYWLRAVVPPAAAGAHDEPCARGRG
jgi:two-component system response regulator